MITLCHAAKGGSGTTVVACTRALDSPGPALLVDIEGDIPPMLGISEPDRPGVLDWLTSAAPGAHLADLLISVTPNCTVLPASDVATRAALPAGNGPEPAQRWDALVDWLTEWSSDTGGSVVIDGGTTALPASFLEQCSQRWLVTRACYLALRRAGRLPVRPTGVVLIEEPGRSLSGRDVETSIRAPIVATIAWDARVARSVDNGLLLGGRLPRSFRRALGRIAA
jgi:hypothetical protein